MKKPRFTRPFVWKLENLGSASLTAILRKSLNLQSLQQQLKGKKRVSKKLQKQVKLAKLSQRFWQLSAEERQAVLSDAGVYIFPDALQEADDLEAFVKEQDFLHPASAECLNAKRVNGKKAPRDALPCGWQACTVASTESSRGARELGASVWSATWGRKARKPVALWRWSRVDGVRPPFLHFVCMKDADKGQCLYSAACIEKSATAQQMQKNCDLHSLFNRLPLLFSPSSATIELDDDTVVEIAPNLTVPMEDDGTRIDVDVSDGLAEIGPELAEKLGLFKTARPDCLRQRLVYHAAQFRAVLKVGDIDVLAKGMIMVNASLGNKLRLRKSCIKAEWPSDADAGIQYGLDIVQKSDKCQGKPKLHAQLVSALALRACLVPTREARRQAKADVREFCWERRTYLPDDMEKRAWGLSCPKQSRQEGVELRRIASRYCATDAKERSLHVHSVPQNRVAVEYKERIEHPSPLELLRTTEELEEPWNFEALRTKESMLRGGRRFLAEADSQEDNPRLPLKGVGAGCFALPDVQNILGPQKCIVIIDGEILKGPVVVFRTPLMLPEDIEVWESVDPPAPEQMRFLPDNCIICSCESLGVTSLGGGDYDGDVIFISTDPDLARLVANTPDGRSLKKLRAATRFAKENLARKDLVECSSFMDYINYCRRVDTPSIRGDTCVLAERAQMAAWAARYPAKKRTDFELAFLSTMSLQCYGNKRE